MEKGKRMKIRLTIRLTTITTSNTLGEGSSYTSIRNYIGGFIQHAKKEVGTAKKCSFCFHPITWCDVDKWWARVDNNSVHCPQSFSLSHYPR